MLNSEGSFPTQTSGENRLVQLSWSQDSCAKGNMEQNLETLTAAP